MAANVVTESASKRRFAWIPRAVLVLALLYLFLVGIKLLETSFKSAGTETAEQVIDDLSNPFAGLAAGILFTVLVQSSSVTTSTIVGLVSTGTLPMSIAVPMVMGANVGTTITNTLVSMAHVTRKDEFRRAFAGATVHDFFNLLTVAIVFPIEMITGFLTKSATWLAQFVPASEGGTFKSPVKEAVSWLSKKVYGGVESGLDAVGYGVDKSSAGDKWLAIILAVIAIGVIVTTLIFITKNMKRLMANRIEELMNRVLAKSGLLGLAIGIVITISVQSSSITTSLLIPMFGAGLLRVETGFPLMIGANIGTTVTALLAASVTGTAGLTIALVHLIFNLCGTLIFFPFKSMRRIPVWLGERLADLAVQNRLLVIVYVAVVFVGIPILGIWLF